jgi:hypothetical protein
MLHRNERKRPSLVFYTWLSHMSPLPPLSLQHAAFTSLHTRISASFTINFTYECICNTYLHEHYLCIYKGTRTILS